jgi:hypothetical protein
MHIRKDKILYRRNLKAGIVTALVLAILLFGFFPEFKRNKALIQQSEPLILLSDVPSTVHDNSFFAPPHPPMPEIIVSDYVLEWPLPDVEMADVVAAGNNANGKNIRADKGNSSFSPASFIPKQTLEVFPEKSKNHAEGEVKLSLRIGGEGKALAHKVLLNTTGSEECLQNSIKAAYKSRWNPVDTNLVSSGYWVEKTYEFR